MNFGNTGVIDPALLMALSQSVESATSAIANGDVQKLEFEISRQRRLLSRVPDGYALEGNEVVGDGGDGTCARDQHRLCAVLARQVAVFTCAVNRALRTITALRSLLPSADGTYS